MQRIQYHRYGGPSVMRLEPYALPNPQKNQIVVRVKAASINPLDWKLRQGFMKIVMGGRFPRGMGMDFSGIVETIGPDVVDLSVGDDVMGQTPMTSSGAFAETTITTADLVIRKPAALSFVAAAALPSVGVTAWRALMDAGGLKPGLSVFINGAAGGVGQAAVAIAKANEAKITVRVGPSYLADAAALGLARVIDYTQPIPDDLWGRFDIVFDCHGSLTARQEDRLLKRSGVAVDIDPTVGNLFRSLISPKHRLVRGLPSQPILQQVAALATTGQFPVTTRCVYSLSEAITLIGEMEAGRRSAGKAVIVMA